jgi:hypothetical protein
MPLLANRLLIPLPPIWLLGVAAAATLACALAGYGLLRLVLPRSAAEARASLRDGFLGPLSWLLAAFAALAAAITPALWSTNPSPLEQIGRSLVRLVADDGSGAIVPINPRSVFRLSFPRLRPQEIRSLELTSTKPLVVRAPQPSDGLARTPDLDIAADRPWSWQRTDGAPNPLLGQRPQLEVSNLGTEPAELRILWYAQFQRNRANGAHIGRDQVALLAVATGDRLHEFATLIAERNRKPVNLRISEKRRRARRRCGEKSGVGIDISTSNANLNLILRYILSYTHMLGSCCT